MSFETDFDSAFTILLGKAAGVLSQTGTVTPPTTGGGTGVGISVTAGIEFVIDGGGFAITTGIAGGLIVPFNCVITKLEIQEFNGTSGSIAVDVKAGLPGNNPTFSTLGSVSVSGGRHGSTDLSATLDRGDMMQFVVTSVSTLTRVTVAVYVRRTDVEGIAI